jgi:uncharacterized protein involved in outer membrane biogenesis
LIFLGGLVFLIILSLVVLPSLINLERYRGMIAEQVGKALGRKVSVGAMRLTLLTGLGAEMTEVQIAEDPLFGDRPFVTANTLQVRVKLLPLFQGRVEITHVLLEAPKMFLIRDRQGRWNYQGVFERGQPPATVEKTPAQEGPREGVHLPPFLMTNLRMGGGEIVVLDRRSLKGKPLKLGEVHLTASQRDITTPVTFVLEGTVALSPPARLRVSGQAGPLPSEGFHRLPVQGHLALQGLDLKAIRPYMPKQLPFHLDGKIDLDVKGEGVWETLTFKADADLAQAGIEYLGLFRKGPGEAGEFHLSGELLKDRMEVSSLLGNIKGVRFEGKGTVKNFFSPHVTFSLAAPKLDLKRLLSWSSAPLVLGRAAWAAVRPSHQDPAGGWLHAAGQVKVGVLQWADLELHDLTAALMYQPGMLRLQDLIATLYGGSIKLDGEMEEESARIHFRPRLEGVKIQPLLKTLFEPSWSLQGLLSLEGNVRGPLGGPLRTFLSRATGEGRFRVRDGRLADLRPVEELKRVLAPLAKSIPLDFERFDQLQGTYILHGGYLKTKDLTMIQGENKVTAVGQFAFADSSLDFDVTATTPLLRLEAKVTGTMADPTIAPTGGALRRRIEMEMSKEQKKKIQEFFQELWKR